MKTTLFLLLMSIGCLAQVPVKLNDTTWAIQTVTLTSDKGARNIALSDFGDSLTILKKFQEIVEAKYQVAISRTAERDFLKLDTILQNITGDNYEATMKKGVQNDIQGKWKIKAPDTTYSVVFDKLIIRDTLKNAIGSIEINHRLSVTVNGIAEKPLVFNATKDGIVAVLNKKQFYLIKS